MIYIIIGRDNATGNEWVLTETFEGSLAATNKCNWLNSTTNDAEIYRVGTIDSTGRGNLKTSLNAKYAKSEVEYPYVETDSMREYTVAELFPDGAYRHNLEYGAYMCTECAALVGDLETHVKWHNKLLP